MRLRILLTNYNLSWLGGTQTWVKTMAEELTRLGHDVHLFAGDNQYNLFPDYARLDDNYDIAFINHNVCLTALDGLNIKCRVFTSHGIIPELEQPVKGADIYVSVSEEVQDNLSSKGFESVIIRNPINGWAFQPTTVSPKLSKVLFCSNYQGNALEVIKQASEGLVELRVMGKDVQGSVQENMQWADLVIGLGRTAYEAMSMNKNVLIYDYNGCDGLVTPETAKEFRKNNCSGRRYKKQLTPNDLRELYAKYDPNLKLRPYILENNNVERIAEQYLGLRHFSD